MKCIAGILLYLVVEGLCLLGLLLLDRVFNYPYDPNISALSELQRKSLTQFVKAKRGQHVWQDPILGWLPVVGTNSAGIRDNREPEKVPPEGTIRIAAFGDSFTYGEDVALDETWERQLMSIDPSVEVLNYGVPAYGLDQAYLRYLRSGSEYRPHIVFIGYMSENIARNVNVFRAFYTRMYRDTIFTKPRFKVKDDQLVQLENPLSTVQDYERLLLHERETLAKLGESDYHYRTNYNQGFADFLPSVRMAKLSWGVLEKRMIDPIYQLDGTYDRKSEAYDVTLRIFDAFYRKVLEDGSMPVIILFPDLNDQERSRRKKKPSYSPVVELFQQNGYRFIDALAALKPYEARYAVKDLVRQWGHYSPTGNRIIAEHIRERLTSWNLKQVESIMESVLSERRRLGATRPLRAY